MKNKKRKIKIGIVGCGAIGSSLSLMLREKFKKNFEVVALCDLDISKAESLQKRLGGGKVVSLQDLIRLSDLVIEAASAKASFDIVQQSLRHKKDVLMMSIGGVLGREKELFKIAERNHRKIYFPSGAICGLDGIKALSLAGIEEITLKTSKPPMALKGADYVVKNRIDLDVIKEETLIFSGGAQEAVKAFPQNINVVALLSLAAKGQVMPRVDILASPGLKRNIHEIKVKSRAGELTMICENEPSPDNPKTSYLAILSAVATIAGISDFTRVGT